MLSVSFPRWMADNIRGTKRQNKRGQMALDTIAYKVTRKTRPDAEFNFMNQDREDYIGCAFRY